MKSDGAFKRSHRVAQVIQQELAGVLTEGLQDPRVGFVTITEVRLSDDLRSARVYVSVYGTDDERASSIEGLQDAAGYLKRELGRRIRLRYTPELSFVPDDSLNRAERLDTLLKATSEADLDPPEPASRQAIPVETQRTAMQKSRSALDANTNDDKRPETKRRQRVKRNRGKGRKAR